MAATNRLLLAAVVVLLSTAAVGQEAGVNAGTTANLKNLASEHGLLGTLLAMALAAVMTLFTLYMLERPKREAALAKQGEEHTKEIAAKDAAHASDRAEWHASTTLLQESRLALMREVLTAIERATAVMNATQGSINERTQSAARIVDQLESLVQATRDLRSSTVDELEALRKAVRATSQPPDRWGNREAGH